MRLHVHELLRRFLLHVLPDGFVRIRSYRLLANRDRHARLTTLPRYGTGRLFLIKPSSLPRAAVPHRNGESRG